MSQGPRDEAVIRTLLDPPALLARLAASLDALGTGAVDLPERQRTLRATVEWSVGLLEDPERSLLEAVAVFTYGWTIPAAAAALRQSEDDLMAQVRQMLGAERFDQAFSAGSRLTQQEAVAIVRDQHRTGTQTP